MSVGVALDFGGLATGLLLAGGAITESSSSGLGDRCFIVLLRNSSEAAGNDEGGAPPIAPGLSIVSHRLEAGVGRLRPLELELSLFGRYREEPGVIFAAAVFGTCSGVDSASGRNSFSSSVLR